MFILAVQAEREYFRVVLMKFRGKRMKIEFLHEFKKNVQGFDELFSEVKKILPQISIASALPIESVFLRKISFPLKKFSSVRKALPFQLESILPPQENEVKILTQMKKESQGIRVDLFAFRKEMLEKHIQEMQELNLDPDWVTSISIALGHFALMFVPPRDHLILFHFGWEESHYVYLKGGNIEAAKSVVFGFKDIIDSIETHKFNKKEFSTEHLFELIQESHHCQKVIHRFIQEHERVLDYFRKQVFKETFSIVYTGYEETISLIAKEYEHFGLEELAITPHLEFDQETIALHAIEIGIALSASPIDSKSFQFRTNEMSSKKIKKQLVSHLSKIVVAGVSLLMLMFGGFQLLLMQKEQDVKHLLQQVAFSTKKELGPLEKEVSDLKKEYKKRGKQELFLSSPKKVSEVLMSLHGFTIQIEKMEYHLSSKEAKISFFASNGEDINQMAKVEKKEGENVYQAVFPLI